MNILCVSFGNFVWQSYFRLYSVMFSVHKFGIDCTRSLWAAEIGLWRLISSWLYTAICIYICIHNTIKERFYLTIIHIHVGFVASLLKWWLWNRNPGNEVSHITTCVWCHILHAPRSVMFSFRLHAYKVSY